MKILPIAVKAGIYLELIIITVLLAFPFEKYGPYSRGMLENQVIGAYWLLGGNFNSIPREAAEHYNKSGLLLIVIALFISVSIIAGAF